MNSFQGNVGGPGSFQNNAGVSMVNVGGGHYVNAGGAAQVCLAIR